MLNDSRKNRTGKRGVREDRDKGQRKTCPKCGTESLIPAVLKRSGIEIDRCNECHGIWLEGGELEDLLGELSVDFHVPSRATSGSKRCPECDEPLYVVGYPHTGIIIDICKKCGGVWLDHGEYGQIRKALHMLKDLGWPRRGEKDNLLRRLVSYISGKPVSVC
ncbi:MAG: zf-TFIIB domain-containing protein [Planctomycetes bacterium]|nr:zf-TFIIB domain-containing protein [Planctomycetota bacterium]